MRKHQVIDGEHENKMQASFAIERFCKMGFMDWLSGKYRRPEFTADTLGQFLDQNFTQACCLSIFIFNMVPTVSSNFSRLF